MRIFNNFDTNLIEKEFDSAVEKHGEENVILIQRTYAFWVINGIIPFVILAVLIVFSFFVYFEYIHKYNFFGYIIVGVLILLIFFILRYLINRYLDFKFDFTIITKEGVFTFKQLGFFNSKNKDFPASKIRSISSCRNGLLGNIFGYGNVEIITDGSLTSRDEEGSHLGGKMIMTYVKNPNLLRKKIIEVCLMRK